MRTFDWILAIGLFVAVVEVYYCRRAIEKLHDNVNSLITRLTPNPYANEKD